MGRRISGATNSKLAKAIARHIQLPRVKKLNLKSGPHQGTHRVPGLRNQRFTGTRPSAATQAQMRRNFNAKNGPRDQFLDKVRREASVTDLQALGLSDKQIKHFLDGGSLPPGFQVHHRQPIMAGGDNSLDNLVLIRNSPDHKLITAAQNEAMRGIPPGGHYNVELPMTPPGLTWPTPGMGAYR
ncbi:HNH endonuclease signature motif containing protein [Propionibacteriaceae bacterium Y1923]|uniref:HNH endonuclease signature motif containing protein n=1 Tax=Aestuariimicrobium sp. Y1814 TaxID=3418742 RepID=UPI003C146575